MHPSRRATRMRVVLLSAVLDVAVVSACASMPSSAHTVRRVAALHDSPPPRRLLGASASWMNASDAGDRAPAAASACAVASAAWNAWWKRNVACCRSTSVPCTGAGAGLTCTTPRQAAAAADVAVAASNRSTAASSSSAVAAPLAPMVIAATLPRRGEPKPGGGTGAVATGGDGSGAGRATVASTAAAAAGDSCIRVVCSEYASALAACSVASCRTSRCNAYAVA